MHSEATTRIALVVLLMIFVLLAASGNIFNSTVSGVLTGIAASVIAAVFAVVFLRDLDRRNEAALTRIEQAVLAISTANSEFLRVNRNVDMGETFWLSLVDELGTSREPVCFLGNKLSRWRDGAAYATALRQRLAERMRAAVSDSNENNEYLVFVMVTDEREIPQWQDFLSSIVSNAQAQAGIEQATVQRVCQKKLNLLKLSREMVKYSAVLCGEKLAVTPYTSSGRLEDSPTVEIRSGSVTRRLYQADLTKLASSQPSMFRVKAGGMAEGAEGG